MKFGDIVVNDWASNANPQKVLMVVSWGGKGDLIHCLAINGNPCTFRNDAELQLKKVGEIDFSGWKALSIATRGK